MLRFSPPSPVQPFMITQPAGDTMHVFPRLVVLSLVALAECVWTPYWEQPRSEEETPQDEQARRPNTIMSSASERRGGQGWNGGEFHPLPQPMFTDNDGSEYLTGTRKNVSLQCKNMPTLWKAMKTEINAVKVKVDETRAVVFNLAERVENILHELETNSDIHRRTERKEEEEMEEVKEELENEEENDDQEEEKKETDDDYQEVKDDSRIITLTPTDGRPSCPSGFVDFDNQCLLLKAGRAANYATAERKCAQQGGRLAIPSNAQGLAFLAARLYPDSDEYWVGLHYDLAIGGWRRSDGNMELNARTLLGLENKDISSNGAECALLKIRPLLQWQAQPCGFFYSFICEADRVE